MLFIISMTLVSLASWESLTPDEATTAVLVPSLGAFITNGECVMMKSPVYYSNMEYCYCRVLRAHPNTHELQVQLMLPAMNLKSTEQEGLFPPVQRAYIDYPHEIVFTNLIAEINPATVCSEVFVMTVDDVESTLMANALGMSNAFCVRYNWNVNTNSLMPIGGLFVTFPSGRDSYSKRAWCLVQRCHCAITTALNRGSLNQNLSFSQFIPCSYEEWQYLKRRMSPVTVFLRHGVLSSVVVRRNGTRECIKSHSVKEIIRVDTEYKLALLRSIVGSNCFVGFRKRPPLAPQLKKSSKYAFSSDRLHHFDVINAILNLDRDSFDEPVGEYIPYPTNRGIDLRYDTKEGGRLRIMVRYERYGADDPAVKNLVNVESAATQHSSNYDDLPIEVGTEFERNSALYKVASVVGEKMVCEVVESNNTSVLVGAMDDFTRTSVRQYLYKYINS
jgi:hypothetical protein